MKFHIAYIYPFQVVFVEKYVHCKINRNTFRHFLTRFVFMMGSDAITRICNPSEPEADRKMFHCFLQSNARRWTEFTVNLQLLHPYVSSCT